MRHNPTTRYAILLCGLLFISATPSQSSFANTPKPVPSTETHSRTDTPYRTETFRASSGGTLNLSTRGGSLKVNGSDTETVIVEMFVRRNGRNLTAEQSDLRNFDIEISQQGNRILVKAERNSRSQNILTSTNESVSFVVSIPRAFNVEMATSGGSLTLTDVTGDLQGRTSGGSISMSDLAGNISMRTSGGTISMTNVSGTVEASTSGGTIRAEQSSGKLTLSTSGGSIRLTELDGEISATTSGGSINASFTTLSGALSLRTSGGSISVDMPGQIGMDVNIRGSRVRMPLQNFSGQSESDRIIGSIHGGGLPVDIRTSGGTVTVNLN